MHTMKCQVFIPLQNMKARHAVEWDYPLPCEVQGHRGCQHELRILQWS